MGDSPQWQSDRTYFNACNCENCSQASRVGIVLSARGLLTMLTIAAYATAITDLASKTQ
jgi:hypothetical protein